MKKMSICSKGTRNDKFVQHLTALVMAAGVTTAGAQSTNTPPAKAGAPAQSTSSNTSTNSPTQLPDVVVKGQQEKPAEGYKPEKIASPKYVEPLRDTPQTLNVVPQAVMQDQGAVTLRDVLRNVPGISFQAGEGGVPAGDQMSIRGFSARTDMFIDGVRDVAGYTRDAFNIEQVEVSKGPNSAYSGRGSTGGVVNMVSKTPKLDAAYGADLSLGTDEYYRATADINQPLPELAKIGLDGAAFRVTGVYHDQDFAGRDLVHDSRWGIAPSFAFGLGTDTRVTLSYLHLQENNLPSYGLPFVSSSNNPYGGASAVGKIAPLDYKSFLGLVGRDYENVANDIVTLKLEHDFNDDIKVQNASRLEHTYRDSAITAPRIITDPPPNPDYHLVTVGGHTYGFNHELQSRDQTDQVFANQTDLTTKFNTGTFEHTLISSLEYNHEMELNYLRTAGVTPWVNGATFYPAPLDNPYYPNPYSIFSEVRRTGAYNQFVSDSLGGSLFDTVKLSEKWIFSVGVRVDAFDITYTSKTAAGAITQLSHSDLAPTWRAGLVYKPVPNGSIYFGYGTSFNPSAEGLTLSTTTANLDPETSQSFELGTKWEFFDDRLSLSGALFRTDKNNYRTTDPVTAVVSTTGEVLVQGIELGVSGKLTEDWSVYGGYAVMESKILSSTTITTYNGVPIPEQGHRLSNTPEQTASIWTTYELPHGFSVGTGVQFVDKRFSNNIETSSVPGYWLQDGMVSWKANKNLTFRVNVSNLWNEKYIDRVGGGHSIPGVGRTAILTASLRF